MKTILVGFYPMKIKTNFNMKNVTLKEFTERDRISKLLESYAGLFLDEGDEKTSVSKSFKEKINKSTNILMSINDKDIPKELISEEDFHDVRFYLCKITSKLK